MERKHAVPLVGDTPLSKIGKNTVDPQTQCMLRPQSGLLRAKEGRYMRHELHFVKH